MAGKFYIARKDIHHALLSEKDRLVSTVHRGVQVLKIMKQV